MTRTMRMRTASEVVLNNVYEYDLMSKWMDMIDEVEMDIYRMDGMNIVWGQGV
jgi:hypothetical protein